MRFMLVLRMAGCRYQQALPVFFSGGLLPEEMIGGISVQASLPDRQTRKAPQGCAAGL